MTVIDTLNKDFVAIKAQYFRGVVKIDLKILNFKHPLVRKYYCRLSKKKGYSPKKYFQENKLQPIN